MQTMCRENWSRIAIGMIAESIFLFLSEDGDSMPATEQRILKKMLDRLFASLVNGPSLNCRPHSSRQRIDLTQLAKLQDVAPEDILRQLLGETRSCKVNATVKPPKGKVKTSESNDVEVDAEPDDSPEEKRARQTFTEQNAVLNKLR